MSQDEMKSMADMEMEEDTYYNSTALSRISMAAKLISWLFALVGAIMLGWTVYNVVQAGVPLSQVFSNILNTLFIVLIAWFFAVMLQAIGEGIYVAMDIAENTRPTGK